MKWPLYIIGLLVLAGIGTAAVQSLQNSTMSEPRITNFEECVAAGNPVMESYPRQCRSADGTLFVENIEDEGMQVPNPPNGNVVGQGCAIAGCSGQLCVSADEAGEVVTTCEYRPEYACYANATCEQQANGECGWTETEELRACIADAQQNNERSAPQVR